MDRTYCCRQLLQSKSGRRSRHDFFFLKKTQSRVNHPSSMGCSAAAAVELEHAPKPNKQAGRCGGGGGGHPSIRREPAIDNADRPTDRTIRTGLANGIRHTKLYPETRRTRLSPALPICMHACVRGSRNVGAPAPAGGRLLYAARDPPPRCCCPWHGAPAVDRSRKAAGPAGRPGRSGVVVVGAGTNNACGVRTLGPWPRPRAHSTTAAHGGNNALASSGRRARVVFVSKSASLPRHFTTHRRGYWPGCSSACPAPHRDPTRARAR